MDYQAMGPLFGQQPPWVILVAAGAMWLVGLLWMRRILRDHAELRSFRATAERPYLRWSDRVTIIGAVLGVAAIVMLFLALQGA